MIAQPITQIENSEERRAAPRTRTFLKGIVYYDERKSSAECIVRELSDTGALITVDSVFAVPDDIELHIPQKQSTLPARVVWREKREIAVSFQARPSSASGHPVDQVLVERIAKLENELAAMKRVMRKLEAKVLSDNSQT